jgi:hypothetical protein
MKNARRTAAALIAIGAAAIIFVFFLARRDKRPAAPEPILAAPSTTLQAQVPEPPPRSDLLGSRPETGSADAAIVPPNQPRRPSQGATASRPPAVVQPVPEPMPRPSPARPNAVQPAAPEAAIPATPPPADPPRIAEPPAAPPPPPTLASPPVSLTPPASRPQSEVSALQQVITQYQQVYNQLDARAVVSIWPSVDARELNRIFARLERQDLSFDSCVFAVSEGTATAQCDGWLRYVPRVGNKTARSEHHLWTIQLKRTAGAWSIAQVTAR